MLKDTGAPYLVSILTRINLLFTGAGPIKNELFSFSRKLTAYLRIRLMFLV